MIVCHCKGVTDRDIRRMVEQGALPHCEEDRVRAAGTECGGCRTLIDRILLEQLGASPANEDGKPAAG
jgi:bacterioferritin-associated ferredoxin